MIVLPLVLALGGSAAVADDLKIPHERYTLPNGLEVVLAPDHSNPIVHTQVWYHVGSKDETEGLTGFAHLFEHLMFQGSKHAPGEYFTPIQEIGGDLNGTTNSDRTNYFETVPSQYLPLALFMESDRMGWLLEVLDQGKLDNQREVVRNERRQRYENPPYGEAWSDLMATLYPAGHPYHHPTIGSHADLEAADLEDVKSFFRTWYGPNNASLVVVGDFEPATAKNLIVQYFGPIEAGPAPTRLEASTPTLPETIVVEQADDVPDAKLWMAWHSPALYAPGDAALDIGSSLLCDGKDSRLYQTIVKERGLARELGCYQVSRQLTSAYIVTATAAEGHSTDEIAAAVTEALTEVATASPPTEAEVKAGITNFEVGFYRRLSTIAGKGGTLSGYLHMTDRTDYLQDDLDRYLSLDPTKVQTAIRDVLTAPHVELHIRPATEEAE